ncbi:MAG: hypothetical protein QOG10_4288, partial [Kribbellaceae bacterium]|nr:hypothetical protein [Kribbellaceae bacterium]
MSGPFEIDQAARRTVAATVLNAVAMGLVAVLTARVLGPTGQ